MRILKSQQCIDKLETNYDIEQICKECGIDFDEKGDRCYSKK